MKLIRQTILYFQDGKSDKVYEIDLCEVGAEQFLVNFRYGRRGSTLREGTKTDLPVNQREAEKVFQKLIVSKTKKGYRETFETSAENIHPTEIKIEEEANSEIEIQEGFHISPEHLKAFLNLFQSLINPNFSPEISPTDIASSKNETKQSSDSMWGLFKRLLGETDHSKPWHQRSNSKKLQSHDKKLDRLNRLIWRSGELRIQDALPLLLDVEISKNSMTDYCLVWAFGRLGDKEAIERLNELESIALKKYTSGFLRILNEAKMACSSTIEQAKLLQNIMDEFPLDLTAAVQKENSEAFMEAVDRLLKNSELSNIIADLYLVSQTKPFIRKCLLEWVDQVPFEGNGYFRGVRQLFKAAEFRDDGELLGLLAYRIQMEPSNFEHAKYGSRFINGKRLSIAQEIKKPDSPFAFSKATKEYFKRRCNRVLARRGEVGDPSYVELATGMLLPYKDDDAKETFSSTYYNHKLVDGRWVSQRKTLNFSKFYPYGTFNSILFKNSPRFEHTKNLKWVYADGYNPESPIPTEREEAYPGLWDKIPSGLLHLLAESKCHEVHQFAVKAAHANQSKILPLIDTEFISLLFAKKYEVTQRFALDLAKAKYNPINPDIGLVCMLLGSSLSLARETGLAWVNANKQYFLNDTLFVTALLFIHYEEVVEWVFDHASMLPKNEEKVAAIIGRCFAQMMAYDEKATEKEQEKISVAGQHLTKHFKPALSNISLELVNDLLSHTLVAVQILGANILLHHDVDKKDLPENLLLGLINGESPELRKVGVNLLGQLPENALVEKEDLLIGLCLSPHAEIRQEVKTVVANLANKNKTFAETFVQRLSPWLLSKEEQAGRDEDLIELLTLELKDHLHAIGKDLTLHLLFSPRKSAHVLGSFLLQDHIDPKELTMRQIVKLGDNEMLSVRQWVWNMFQSNLARIKYEAGDAVRLLESKWDGSRDFALEFFRREFVEKDWKPDVLVSLCDSVNQRVQQFGKEMIAKFFKTENGEQYLLQLSQHPAAALQQFATNYLDNFAANKPKNIEELKPYFITVLSSINKSRVAKKRIFEFLKQEGSKQREVAELVADVMARQSVTMTVTDKAKCIEVMRDLQILYPDLSQPIEIIEFENYPSKLIEL